MSAQRTPRQIGTRYEVVGGERVGVARLEGRAEVIVEAALATAAGLSLAEWGRAVDRLPIPELAVDFVDRRGRIGRGRSLAWLDRLAGLRGDEVPAALQRLWRAAVTRREDLDDSGDDEEVGS